MSYDCQIWAKSFQFWESRDIPMCDWQVEEDFGVLQNKNNDCVISSLRGVFLHDEVSSAC